MAYILVADDSASIRDFVAEALRLAGHLVTTADDGRSALAQLHARSFDVLITDLYMPDVDGLELILRCRESDRRPRVIAISSGGSIVDLLPAARVMGASGTLAKPFTHAQLLHTVQAVLRLPPPRPSAAPRATGANPRS